MKGNNCVYYTEVGINHFTRSNPIYFLFILKVEYFNVKLKRPTLLVTKNITTKF